MAFCFTNPSYRSLPEGLVKHKVIPGRPVGCGRGGFVRWFFGWHSLRRIVVFQQLHTPICQRDFWKEDGLAASLCSAVHNQIHSGFHYWLAQHDLLVPLAGFALHFVQPISASLRFSRCQQDRRASFNLMRRTSASAKFKLGYEQRPQRSEAT